MELSTETAQNTTSGNGWFQTTHWSVVLGAGEPSANGHAALSRLCETYWYPLYSYVRRSGQAPADAQDLTQGFFARLLEKDYLLAAAPGKGRFRSFLLMTLKRFMANEWDKANCQKRGGGREIISLNLQDTENQYRVEPIDEVTPEKLYNRSWAGDLLGQVMA